MLLRSARKAARQRAEDAAKESPGAAAPQQDSSAPASFLTVSMDASQVATVFSSLCVRLTNSAATKDVVMFKLQTNLPRRYRVVPEPFGALRAGETAVVQIYAQIEADGDTNEGDLTASSQTGAAPSQAGRPVRSRSGSSRSLATLLQHRERESAADIKAESQAALVTDRISRRTSYLATRRSSDLRGDGDQLTATRRALETQMSFYSADSARLSMSVTSSGGEDPPLPAYSRAEPSVALPAPLPQDLIRIEGRLCAACVDDEEFRAIKRSREAHRDRWTTLVTSTVEVIPIRSEPLTKKAYDEMIANVEESLGLPQLQEELLSMQGTVKDLQDAFVAQQQRLTSSEHVTSAESVFLQNTLSATISAVVDAAQQASAAQRFCMVSEEEAARLDLDSDEIAERTALVLDSSATTNEYLAMQNQLAQKAMEAKQLAQQRFGQNPPPPVLKPPLVDFLRLAIPLWVALLAVCAAWWSCLLRPLAFGVD